MNSFVVKDENNVVIDKLYQWDANIKISIFDIAVSQSVMVHFSITDGTESLAVEPTVDGTTLTVDIPNILLESSGSLFVFIYDTVGNADGRRVTYGFRIPVVQRAKPTSYVHYDNCQYIGEHLEYIQELADIIATKTGDDTTLEWNGDAIFSGNVLVNGYKKVATYDLVENLVDRNSFDIVKTLDKNDTDAGPDGITFTWMLNGTCYVDGTTGSDEGHFGVNNIYQNRIMLPLGVKTNQKYRFVFSRSSGLRNSDLRLNIKFWTIDDVYSEQATYVYYYQTSGEFTVPGDAIGMTIRLFVNNGVTIDGETVTVYIYTSETNSEISYKTNEMIKKMGDIDIDGSTNAHFDSRDCEWLITDWEENDYWWKSDGTQNGTSGLNVHSQYIPVYPGQELYGMHFGGSAPQPCGGAFFDKEQKWIAPILYPFSGSTAQNVEEYVYPLANSTPNSGYTNIKMWKITVPESAFFISLNLRTRTGSEFDSVQSLSTLPMIGATGTGNRIWRRDDPSVAQKKDKKLYIIGPSTAAINRSKRSVYDAATESVVGNKIIVGFQEYLIPYYKEVVSLAFSGIKTQNTDTNSIYTYITEKTYVGASANNLKDADEVLIMANSNDLSDNNIGVFDSEDETTYCGAINKLIDFLYDENDGHLLTIYLETRPPRPDNKYHLQCHLNEVMRQIADYRGCVLIDVDKKMGANINNYKYITYDSNNPSYPQGGHFNNIGNRIRGYCTLEGLLGGGLNYQGAIDSAASALTIRDNIQNGKEITHGIKHVSTETNGIKYVWNGDQCTVSGVADGNNSVNILFYSESSLPDEITPGKTYYVSAEGGFRQDGISFNIRFFKQAISGEEDDDNIISDEYFYSDGVFTVPTDAVGVLIRLWIKNGTDVSETPILLTVGIFDAPTNRALSKMIDELKEEIETDTEEYVSTPEITEINNPYVLHGTANASLHAMDISDATSGEKLTVCGKNLWNMYGYQIMLDGQRVWNIKQNGVQFVFNPTAGTVRIRTTGFDGASVDGKATATTVSASASLGSDYTSVNGNTFYHNFKFKFSSDTVIAVSDNCSVDPPFNYGVQLRIDDALSDGSAKYGVGSGMLIFKAVAGREYGCRFRVEAGWGGDITFRPQVEINSHPTAFEPYKGSTVDAYANSGGGNIFAIAGNPGYQHDVERKIEASFTTKTIIVKCEAVTSGNRVVYAPNRSSDINGHTFYNVARFEGLSGSVYVGGIPKKYKGIVRGQISDGVNSWYDDGEGVVFNAESGLKYAYRLVCTPSAVIDDVFTPVILTGSDVFVMLRSVSGTTTIMTDGNAKIAATAVKGTASETAEFAGSIAHRIEEITAGRLLSPVGNVTRRPMVSFIDDDTSSDALIVAYHDLCESLGIVGGYAVETNSVDASEGALEHLREYEDEGFSMHYHCKEQHSTGVDNTWYWIDGDKEEGQAAYDEDKIRANFVGGLRAISNYGLLNYKRWVTPYGVNNEYVKQLAKEYGLECLISFSYGNHWQMAHVSRTGNAGKWDIPRVYWDKNVTLARLTGLVQACIADCGWMIVTTHVNSWGTIDSAEWNASVDAFESFVDYCIDEGMEVVPFGVGFETMKPALEMHDLLEL